MRVKASMTGEKNTARMTPRGMGASIVTHGMRGRDLRCGAAGRANVRGCTPRTTRGLRLTSLTPARTGERAAGRRDGARICIRLEPRASRALVSMVLSALATRCRSTHVPLVEPQSAT